MRSLTVFQIKATTKNGLLNLVLPKATAVKPEKITVKAESDLAKQDIDSTLHRSQTNAIEEELENTE